MCRWCQDSYMYIFLRDYIFPQHCALWENITPLAVHRNVIFYDHPGEYLHTIYLSMPSSIFLFKMGPLASLPVASTEGAPDECSSSVGGALWAVPFSLVGVLVSDSVGCSDVVGISLLVGLVAASVAMK